MKTDLGRAGISKNVTNRTLLLYIDHCHHPHHLLGELALPNKVEDGVASINFSRGIMPLPACPKYDQLLKICPIRRTGSAVEVPLSMEKMEFSFC